MSRSFVCVWTFLLGAILQISLEAKPLPAKQEARRQETYDTAASDPLLRAWIDRRMGIVLRDPLDSKMEQILSRLTVAQELLPSVMHDVSTIIEESFVSHVQQIPPTNASSPGYGWLYEMIQQAATDLNFPPEARTKIKLFIVGDDTKNAYTYSSDQNEIHVVFYEGLLKGLTKDEVRQVVGHELGHIKFNHIRNQLLILAIFFATGRNVIPYDSGSAEAKILNEARMKEIESQARKMVRGSLEHFGDKISEEGIEKILGQVKKLGDELAVRVPAKTLKSTVGRMWAALRGMADEEADWDIKDYKQLLEDLDRLSRSAEASCDNAGYYVNNHGGKDRHVASVMAYGKLAGHSQLTIDEVLEGAEQMARAMLKPGAFLKYRQSAGTHPYLTARAYNMELFRKTTAAKVMLDDFTRLITDYFELSKSLMQIKSRAYSKDIMEASSRPVIELNWRFLSTLALAWSDLIVEIITAEFDQAEKDAKEGKPGDITNFAMLVEGIGEILWMDLLDGEDDFGSDPTTLQAKTEQRRLREDMGKADRLIHKLIDRLKRGLPAAPVVLPAEAQIEVKGSRASRARQAMQLMRRSIEESGPGVEALRPMAIALLETLVPQMPEYRTPGLQELVDLARACGGSPKPQAPDLLKKGA